MYRLKIKIMSLAAEARIIRSQEIRNRDRLRKLYRTQRYKPEKHGHLGVQYGSMRQHRMFDVRNEARAALIAYGFLRGREYKAIEAKPQSSPNWDRARALALKYGGLRAKSQIDEWIKAAKEHNAAA